MQIVSGLAMFFSILIPTKVWFAPTQPLTINIKSDAAVALGLTHFQGKPIDPAAANEAAPDKNVDIPAMYPQVGNTRAYLLVAVPYGENVSEVVGAPLVALVRRHKT